MTTQPAQVNQARESARTDGGRFGVQNRPEAETDLPLSTALDSTDTVTSGIHDTLFWRQRHSTQSGDYVREAVVDGISAGHISFNVTGPGDTHVLHENAVEVGYMVTDEARRGRGINRALLASLAADYPDKTFYTENFERPTARRAWEDSLGDADGMSGDGEFECAWCCMGLMDAEDFEDDDSTDSMLCPQCGDLSAAHATGQHTAEADPTCWSCDFEKRNP